ncbi:glycosyltransferase family 2 protein, partial [Conservatibacter flavescens]
YDITFIVPVYNTAEYLAQCLDSIIQQDIHKEIIVINDGSTDNSDIILADYAERFPFIKVITQKNRGVSAARNLGLSQAGGRYIYFVDSDDYFFGKINFQNYITYMDQHNISILKGSIFREETQKFSIPKLPEVQKVASEIYLKQIKRPHHMEWLPSSNYLYYLCQQVFVPTLWAYLFRADYLHQNNLKFNENLTHAEDSLFMIQALTCQEFLMLETSEIFYVYRNREGSTVNTPNNPQAFFAQLNAFNAVQQYALQNDFNHASRFAVMMMGADILMDTFERLYLKYSEETKQQVNHAITVDMLTTIQLYEAASLAFRNGYFTCIEQIREAFRLVLGSPS